MSPKTKPIQYQQEGSPGGSVKRLHHIQLNYQVIPNNFLINGLHQLLKLREHC
jgi:hypothetical protein